MEEVQSVLEDIKVEEVPAPYFQKLLINILDGIIEAGIFIALYLIIPTDTLYQLVNISTYMRYIIALAVILTYRLLLVLIFGKTIGMMICRCKFLNKRLLPLSPGERLSAVFIAGAFNIKIFKN